MPRAARAMRSRRKNDLGREIGGGDLRDVLAGAVGDQHDVGRGGERRQVGDPAGELGRHAGGAELGLARRAGRRASSGSARSSAASTAAMPAR